METKIKKIVNINLLVSLVLIVGLAVIYYLHFNGAKPDEKLASTSVVQTVPSVKSGLNSVVFVNSDKLLQKYSLVEKLMKQLESDGLKKDADFRSKQSAYEQDAAYFQQQVQSQTISEQSAQQIYEQLMVKQQELVELQDKYSAELAQKEFEINVIILDSVRNYLRRANEEYKFDYILSFNETGNILMAKDTFDITEIILEGLNEEYDLIYNQNK